MGPIRPNTAWFGPNEWPNGETHARDDERARGARDGRDRSYRHGVGGSWKQHERTGVTAGALSGQLAASSPAGLAAGIGLTVPIYQRPARGRRAPAGEAWALVIGAGPSVRPIHGSDEAIVSGG